MVENPPPSKASLFDGSVYSGGFRRTELLTMKRRGRNSSTCPRIFRERRKVAATILYEVISFLSPKPLPSSFSFLCLSLPPPLLRYSEKGWRLALWVRRPQQHNLDRPLLFRFDSVLFSGDIKGLLEWPAWSFRRQYCSDRQPLSSGSTMAHEADGKVRNLVKYSHARSTGGMKFFW